MKFFEGGNRALPDRDVIVRFRTMEDGCLFRLVYRAPLRGNTTAGAGPGIGPALLLPQFCGRHDLPEYLPDLTYEKGAGERATNVYLVRNPKTLLTKIGRSGDPKKRLLALRSSEKERGLTLLFSFPGIGNDEEELHVLFADKRVRGEWFSLSDEDVEVVRARVAND